MIDKTENELRQRLYEDCVKRGVPECLAACIAQTHGNNFYLLSHRELPIRRIIGDGFIWRDSILGRDFWAGVWDEAVERGL